MKSLARMRMSLLMICLLACEQRLNSQTFSNTNTHDSKGSIIGRFSRQQIIAELGDRSSSDGFLESVRRSDSGTELYCVWKIRGGQTKTLCILSDSTNWIAPCLGAVAFVGKGHEVVAWTDDYKNGVRLRDGYTIRLPPFALFDVDPGGQFFIIGEKPRTTWLGRLDSPTNRICISTNMLGNRVFVRNGEILVSGWAYNTGRNSIEQTAICSFIKPTADGYRIHKTLSFPLAGSIVDVDPYSEKLLMSGKSDLFANLYLFDETTGKTIKVSVLPDYSFFLRSYILKGKKKK